MVTNKTWTFRVNDVQPWQCEAASKLEAFTRANEHFQLDGFYGWMDAASEPDTFYATFGAWD